MDDMLATYFSYLSQMDEEPLALLMRQLIWVRDWKEHIGTDLGVLSEGATRQEDV